MEHITLWGRLGRRQRAQGSGRTGYFSADFCGTSSAHWHLPQRPSAVLSLPPQPAKKEQERTEMTAEGQLPGASADKRGLSDTCLSPHLPQSFPTGNVRARLSGGKSAAAPGPAPLRRWRTVWQVLTFSGQEGVFLLTAPEPASQMQGFPPRQSPHPAAVRGGEGLEGTRTWDPCPAGLTGTELN